MEEVQTITVSDISEEKLNVLREAYTKLAKTHGHTTESAAQGMAMVEAAIEAGEFTEKKLETFIENLVTAGEQRVAMIDGERFKAIARKRLARWQKSSNAGRKPPRHIAEYEHFVSLWDTGEL